MIIGLTGGICSGKSTAARALLHAGYCLVDCDERVRWLSDNDAQVKAELENLFGPAIFDEAGELKRAELAAIVFADSAARHALEQILHPRILEWMTAQISRARSRETDLIMVVPLLFELNLARMFDETWLVSCDAQEQLVRLCQRSGLTQDEAQLRIAAQWPAARKAPLATRIIPNNDTIESFTARVLETAEGVLGR